MKASRDTKCVSFERPLKLDVDGPTELSAGFPRDRNELFRYRAIILGSIEASFFTHEQLQMLADFVGTRGGGMLFLGGRQSFAEGGYAGTPLSAVMPVDLDPVGKEDFFVELKAQATAAGAAHAVKVADVKPAAVSADDDRRRRLLE